MVHAVKARAHPQPLTPAAKPQAQVGVLQVLAELRQGHDGHILAGRNTYQLGHQHHHHVADQVIEQVVAVVAPLGHLTLGMVQRVQLPPPTQAVLATVDQVVECVQHHQVEQQADQRQIRHSRPNGVEVPGGHARHAPLAKQRAEQWLHRKKHGDPEQTEAVNQGVEHIGAYRGAVGHRLDRAPALQRANHRHHDQQLQQADQQPARGIEPVWQQVPQADGEHQRLQHLLKQQALQV